MAAQEAAAAVLAAFAGVESDDVELDEPEESDEPLEELDDPLLVVELTVLDDDDRLSVR
ncbi:hypothetical protein FHS43_006806 [Streptosporangium becharense]|uniref:Uncharacterized protein n=1 Tax=Streptosporangium becharense TaxID=1816182 RepID=A0A7W9MHJ5_9ACTN|nr:hypothetical protein [Streptosporangium becharense]MBB2915485.1 hypothetical protein [Streptosporangium becharense]MBB5820990.1 hypothetical protein [Streptosporangium becharense]